MRSGRSCAILSLGSLMAAPPEIIGGGALGSCAMSDRGIHPPPKIAKPSYRYTYRNEPHANISPDGSKVIFASNWGVEARPAPT